MTTDTLSRTVRAIRKAQALPNNWASKRIRASIADQIHQHVAANMLSAFRNHGVEIPGGAEHLSPFDLSCALCGVSTRLTSEIRRIRKANARLCEQVVNGKVSRREAMEMIGGAA